MPDHPRLGVRRLLTSLAVAGSAPLVALAAPPAPELPPASPQTGVTYTENIRSIFQENCFRCHGADRAKGDLRLDSLEAALKGSEDGKVILPGDSAASPLVLAVARVNERSAMPPIRKPRPGGGPPAGNPPPVTAKALTPAEVGLIRAWIDQGAL